MFGLPLAYRAVTAGSGDIKIHQNLPAVAYRAKSLGKSHCDGRDMPTVAPTTAPIFKPKKGFTTISLGMNYCSMGLSQPLFCDTVPLNFKMELQGIF
jgi:hypothetical protein